MDSVEREVQQLETELEELMKDTFETSESSETDVEETQDTDTSNDEDLDTSDTEDTDEGTSSDDAEEILDDTSETTEDESSETEESTTVADTSTDWEARYKEVQAFATKVAQQNTALVEQLQKLSSKVDSTTKDEVEDTIDKRAQAMEAFKEEYPELAELLMPVLEVVAEEKIKPVTETIDTLTTAELTREQQDFNKQIQEVVPDVMDIVQSKDFADWMAADTMLPSTIKASLFTSSNVKDATSLLGQYKLEKRIRDDRLKQKKKTTKNKAAADAASVDAGSTSKNPKTFSKTRKGKPKFSIEEISKMSLEDFEKYEKEIDGPRRY